MRGGLRGFVIFPKYYSSSRFFYFNRDPLILFEKNTVIFLYLPKNIRRFGRTLKPGTSPFCPAAANLRLQGQGSKNRSRTDRIIVAPQRQRAGIPVNVRWRA